MCACLEYVSVFNWVPVVQYFHCIGIVFPGCWENLALSPALFLDFLSLTSSAKMAFFVQICKIQFSPFENSFSPVAQDTIRYCPRWGCTAQKRQTKSNLIWKWWSRNRHLCTQNLLLSCDRNFNIYRQCNGLPLISFPCSFCPIYLWRMSTVL